MGHAELHGLQGAFRMNSNMHKQLGVIEVFYLLMFATQGI